MSTTTQSGYAPVNGLNLYYERTGTGSPLILLHGGYGMTGMFAGLLPAFAAEHQVIAVDLQGCGRTADIDRPLRFEHMADDIAALITHLGLGKVNLLGYSLGGAVAMQVAIRHPELIERLIVVSTVFKRSAWHNENLAGMDQMSAETGEFMKQTPLYGAYAQVAPRPEDWSNLWDKTGEMLRQDYDWSAEIAKFVSPTMLIFGDADSVSLAHAAEFFGLLGGGQRDGSWDRSGVTPHRLAILPNTTHYDILASAGLAPAVLAFIAAPSPTQG